MGAVREAVLRRGCERSGIDRFDAFGRRQTDGTRDADHRPRPVPRSEELLLRVLRDERSDYEIAFFCECGRPGCYAPVWLTAGVYETRVAASQPIVQPDHLRPGRLPARASGLLPAA
jgi:hypothetical protein